LDSALKRANHEVIYRRQTLRELGVLRYAYALRMILSAYWVYRRSAWLLMDRTRAAFVARSRVNARLVQQNPEVDAVILIASNSGYEPPLGPGRPQLLLYMDHGNLLSKALAPRGFSLEESKIYPVWNSLERRALRMQDRILVMGKLVKPALEAAYGLQPEKVRAVGAGPGLDADIERDRGSKDPLNRTILFVGKLAPVKGLAILLQAFARVRDAYPDATLHVVTPSAVAAPGVVPHTQLEEGELKKLFYSCCIFAMPAFKEPLGLVFVEAMWSKCACVGTTTGSMPELIEDGVTGYLVEPGDAAALADRLMTLLADPEKTRIMGERGYAAAQRYWNWDAVVARMFGEKD
jgi:glycosyltransferase involved in cell wall biosynthesis